MHRKRLVPADVNVQTVALNSTCMHFLENISTIALLRLGVVRVTERHQRRKEHRGRTNREAMNYRASIQNVLRVKNDGRSVPEQRGNLMKRESYELFAREQKTRDSELSLCRGSLFFF